MGIAGNNSLGVTASGTPPAGDLANAVFSGVFTAVGPSAPFPFQGWGNFAIWASVSTALTTTAGSTTATVASGTGIAPGASVKSVNVPAGTTYGAFTGTSGTLVFPPQTYPATPTSNGHLDGLPPGVGAHLVGATVTGPGVSAGTTVLSVLSSTSTADSIQLSSNPTVMPTEKRPRQAYVFNVTGNAVTGGTDSGAVFTGAGLTWGTGVIQVERTFDGGFTWNCCNVGGAGQLAQYSGGPVNNSWQEPEQGVLYRFNCVSYTSGNINYRMSQNAGPAMSLFTGGVV